MYTIKKINFLIFLVLISIGYPQGRMNSYGLGHYYSNQGARNAVDGLSALSPTISNNISFSNPSTWHNLNYTYLSLSYSGEQNSLNDHSNVNGYSGLSEAMLIIPIKSKFSLGFSLSPYINQKINLQDKDTLTFLAFDDTLNIARLFFRSGGVMAFNFGASYKINQKISFGILNNVLFGSSRQSELINFGGNNIVQSARNRYNGLISSSFASIKLSDNIKFYTSYKITIKPLESAYKEKYLFDDANSNGYHDWSAPYFDFPFPDSVNIISEDRIGDLHKPTSYIIGIDRRFGKWSAFSFEYFTQIENSLNIKNIYIPTSNWIDKTRSLKFLYSKYANQISLKLFDKISFRSGILYSSHYLGKDNVELIEYGWSIGSGFKFKRFGNQIDLNYYFGFREYPDTIEKEIIQQLQFGVSIGDIWFIKRRQK